MSDATQTDLNALSLLADSLADPSALDRNNLLWAMTRLASACWQSGNAQAAADFLAFVQRQPDLPGDIRSQADELFSELESRVCPRIIADAIAYAADMDSFAMIAYARDILSEQKDLTLLLRQSEGA